MEKNYTVSVQLISKRIVNGEKKSVHFVCSPWAANSYSTPICSVSGHLYAAVYGFCNLCCPSVCGNYIFSSQKKSILKSFLCVFYDPGRFPMFELNFRCLYGSVWSRLM